VQPFLCDSERERLILDHLHCVHAAARSFLPHNSAIVQDELISAGYQALVLASRRFDPSRTVAFSTYAYSAIRGAMTDSLSTVSRAFKHHAPLSDVDADSLHDGAHSTDPDRSTLTAQVLAALDRLPYAQQAVLKAHFLEEKRLADVATQLGISKTRASGLLAEAIQALRKHLDDGAASWPPRSTKTKRRFSSTFRSEVVRHAQNGASSISQLARDLNVPATNIRSWLKRGSRGDTQLAAA